MEQKAFFIIFRGISLKQINISFLEGESPTLIPVTDPLDMTRDYV